MLDLSLLRFCVKIQVEKGVNNVATIQGMTELHNRVLSSDSIDSIDFESSREDPDSAEWKYKKIMEQIQKFEADLDNEHEIGIYLASFGSTIKMAVRPANPAHDTIKFSAYSC